MTMLITLFGFLYTQADIGYIFFLIISLNKKATGVLQIKVDEEIINVENTTNGKKVMLDTGTSTLSLSTPVYKELFSALAETEACFTEQGTTLCLCNEEVLDYYPNITFTLPGIDHVTVTFNITARQYMINPMPLGVKDSF